VKVAILFSGGKDSTYAVYIAQQMGWEVRYLVSIIPEAEDSYMYHVPNIHLVPLLSEALDIPLVQERAKAGEDEELKALKRALGNLDVDGIVTGAIASDYQHSRINRICHDLGLRVFSPLWRKDQGDLLRDYLRAGFSIMIVGVYAQGLDEKWLGRVVDEACLRDLLLLRSRYGINISGEGGEFESLVLDGPNFKKRLEVERVEKMWDGSRGALKVVKASLVQKLFVQIPSS